MNRFEHNTGLLRLVLFLIFLTAVPFWGCSSDQIANEDPIDNGSEPMDPVSFEDKLVIHYLDLVMEEEKVGDAIIIQTPDSVVMIIDAGRTPGGEQVERYLNDLDIQTIDYAVTTHPHIDHVGGFLTLIETKEIKKFIKPNVYHIATPHRQLDNKIEEYEIEQVYRESGDTFTLGEEVEVKFYSPPEGTEPPNETDTNTINELSLVLKLTYGETSFLFTGDIGMGIESDLVYRYGDELESNFLHVPHHGSETSSSLNFIHTVNPEIAVISGYDNYSDRVYSRYENHGSEVYVTTEDGHIILASDGEQIEVVR